MSESHTTPGVQLEFDLDERAHVVAGPTFARWYSSQPRGFDDAWPNSAWPGRLVAGYRAYLAEHNLTAPPLTRASTSTHLFGRSP